MKYIADKSFYKKVILISLPIIGQFFIRASFNFIDNFMVSGLGEEAIAGLAIANQYYTLFFPVSTAICVAVSVFIAQYYGAKNYEDLRKVFGISLLVPALVSLLFIILGIIFPSQIVTFFNNNSPETINYAISYLQIMIFSFIPYALSQAFTFLLRPIGKAFIPFLISSSSLIINIILNYCLIYGNYGFPELGVEGAALGTLISRIIELLLYLIMYKVIDLPFKDKLYTYFIFDWILLKRVFAKVSVLFINEILFTTSFVLIFKSYSTRGIIAITAINVSRIIFNYVKIVANGLGTTTSILVASKLGSKQFDEAEQNADYLLGYGFILGLIIMTLTIIVGFIVPDLYKGLETETKEIMRTLIFINAITAPFIMLTRIPFFVLRAGGRVKEVFLLDSAFMWAVKIPVAFFFAYYTDLSVIYIYIAVEATRIVNAFISLYYYKKKNWLTSLT